jgi:hypothetical protein
MMRTIQSQVGTLILSLGACGLYGELTRICNVRGLRREWNGSRSCERLRERGEDAEVGMERNALKPSHAERGKPALVLEPTERPLDCPSVRRTGR